MHSRTLPTSGKNCFKTTENNDDRTEMTYNNLHGDMSKAVGALLNKNDSDNGYPSGNMASEGKPTIGRREYNINSDRTRDAYLCFSAFRPS